MRGRKPKPSHLRLLDGNAGHRPLNPDEPIPDGDVGGAPSHLSDAQKILWALTLKAAPAGLLKRLDTGCFEAWVVAADFHRQAVEQVNLKGLLVTISGAIMQNPYLAVVNKQALIKAKLESEMGFTPSSRSRVKVKSSKPAKSNAFAGLKDFNDAD